MRREETPGGIRAKEVRGQPPSPELVTSYSLLVIGLTAGNARKEVRRERRVCRGQRVALGKERPVIADLPPACRAYGPEGGPVLRTLRSTPFEAGKEVITKARN